jgi:hypothetical protein
VSIRSIIHPKFMPKEPVAKVSGTKIVATALTRYAGGRRVVARAAQLSSTTG